MKRIERAVAFAPPLLFWMATAFGQPENSAPSALDIITVTGNMEAESGAIALTPGGASLIDMDDFRERDVGSLADVLRYVPGIWAVSDSGNDEMFFSSRGSNLDATNWDMNGIKLLQDGLPVTTADGNNHNGIIDPLAARYASVLRGRERDELWREHSWWRDQLRDADGAG